MFAVYYISITFNIGILYNHSMYKNFVWPPIHALPPQKKKKIIKAISISGWEIR